MVDVGTQIREYLDATAPPVELEEIFTERVGAPPVRPLRYRPPQRSVQGWVYAVAAAIVLVALIGGAALLLREDSTVEPADQPTVTTVAPVDPAEPQGAARLLGPGAWTVAATFVEPTVAPGLVVDAVEQVRGWPGVLDVVEFDEPTAFAELTGLAVECDQESVEPPCGVGVVVLTVDLDAAETVALRLDTDLGMVPLLATDVAAEFADGYLRDILGRGPPPPLRFDTSGLGVEMPLVGPLKAEEITAARLPMEPGSAAVAVGIEGMDVSALLQAPKDTPGEAFRFEVFMFAGDEGTGGGRGFTLEDSLHRSRAGVLAVLGEELLGGTLGFAVSGLPAEAAAVTFGLADGTVVWQRPVAGMALFVDNDFSGAPLTVLDADGEVLLVVQAGGASGYAVTDNRTGGAAIPSAAASVDGPNNGGVLTAPTRPLAPARDEPETAVTEYDPAATERVGDEIVVSSKSGDVRWVTVRGSGGDLPQGYRATPWGLMGWTYGAPRLWLISDGGDWSTSLAPGGIEPVNITTTRDAVALSGTTRDAPAVWQTTDGETWRRTIPPVPHPPITGVDWQTGLDVWASGDHEIRRWSVGYVVPWDRIAGINFDDPATMEAHCCELSGEWNLDAGVVRVWSSGDFSGEPHVVAELDFIIEDSADSIRIELSEPGSAVPVHTFSSEDSQPSVETLLEQLTITHGPASFAYTLHSRDGVKLLDLPWAAGDFVIADDEALIGGEAALVPFAGEFLAFVANRADRSAPFEVWRSADTQTWNLRGEPEWPPGTFAAGVTQRDGVLSARRIHTRAGRRAQ